MSYESHEVSLEHREVEMTFERLLSILARIAVIALAVMYFGFLVNWWS
jgi:hypothetical protein